MITATVPTNHALLVDRALQQEPEEGSGTHSTSEVRPDGDPGYFRVGPATHHSDRLCLLSCRIRISVGYSLLSSDQEEKAVVALLNRVTVGNGPSFGSRLHGVLLESVPGGAEGEGGRPCQDPASRQSLHQRSLLARCRRHWWTHHGKMRAWDYFQLREELTEEMEPVEAFNKALRTWARWVDRNVDPCRTAFFRSISPEHKRENLQWCYNRTRPFSDNEGYLQLFPKSMVKLVERTLLKMRTPVRYLNVMKLSEFRRDAHTGV
ncbi:hypothetical protein ZIOFF_033904 [Zingiber officinale]|uniref:Trichome birefringence-like C-terminal domain-containing protein n=1 Tax=Zingiber officinale TaxID=94328 RepID=A0A8J5GRE9_ZINOF|nr:hypothetical protein ZIOFF_033904 [Zingiber officinale]